MPSQVIEQMIQKFEDAISYLHSEYAKLQTGRANAALVENIMVEYYGSKSPLKGIANISIPESNQIAIQPWDKGQMPEIEKAIRDSDLGLNPQNDGMVIRLILPPMTEERRKDLIKLVHKYAEDSRISIRNARHEAMGEFKRMKEAKEISEDEEAGKEKEVQAKVDEYNKKIEDASKQKETDIMTV